MSVNKDDYKKWEKEVLKFYDLASKVGSNKYPEVGKHSVVVKDKCVLAAFRLTDYEKILDQNFKEIDGKHKINLWHAGKKQMDSVSIGMDSDNYLAPSVDLGGLTNFRLKDKMPESVHNFMLEYETHVVDLLPQIVLVWEEYIGAKFSTKMIFSIGMALESMHTAFGCEPVYLKLLPIPQQKYVLVTPQDIATFTGSYFVRVYGKGDDHYAEHVNVDECELVCAVSETFVTPNYNRFNVDYETKKCEDTTTDEECVVAFQNIVER